MILRTSIIIQIVLVSITFTLLGQYDVRTSIIHGKKYKGFLDETGFHLLNQKNETILNIKGSFFSLDFRDFNKDGYKDIFLDPGGNTPECFDLFLFVPPTGKFKQVKDFGFFPAPEQINKTKYYYSYHKNGCADLAWVSDLFYIKNFVAIRIGSISGDGCGVKDGINIYKVKAGEKILFKTLPINTIKKYKEYKWGFIREYWNNNFRAFFK